MGDLDKLTNHQKTALWPPTKARTYRLASLHTVRFYVDLIIRRQYHSPTSLPAVMGQSKSQKDAFSGVVLPMEKTPSGAAFVKM